jgi:hypothetical protein
MNKQCLFKASNGWLFNFLRRNRFVLRRITTTGRELPENAIDTILSFIADMEKTFGGIYQWKTSRFDYEKERLLNKQVKERLSQLGLSPRTLKNKQRQLARD